MFWKKKETDADRLRREAVDLAIKRFQTVGLYGNHYQGWRDAPYEDTPLAEGSASVIYQPHSNYERVLWVSGLLIKLQPEDVERIDLVITRMRIDDVAGRTP